MPTKMLLVTEIDHAEADLCNAHRALWQAAQKKVTDEATAIMHRYRDRIAAAVGRLANVSVVNAAAVEEVIELKSRRNGEEQHTKNHYRTAFVIDADGDGRLAELWRQDDLLKGVYNCNTREVFDRASRLRSDLRLVDRCREGDALHKRIVAFVEEARKAKAATGGAR